MQLVLQVLQIDSKLSLRAAAKIYSIDHQKLSRHQHGKVLQRVIPAYSKISSGFLSAYNVEDIVNQLLAESVAGYIGALWAHQFVEQRPAHHAF